MSKKLTKEEQAKQAYQKKMNEMAIKFNVKLGELQDWGISEGIMIGAYLKADHEGIFPYISWVEMTEEQLKMRDDYNANMVKAEKEAEKAEKQSQETA